jgi:CHAD domain-containing protein
MPDVYPAFRLDQGGEDGAYRRVATRRLRSLLRSTRGQVADPEQADWLRGELRWLGRLLGEVRDRDVLIAYLIEELGTLEEAGAFGGTLELLDAERAEARRSLLTALESPRYRRLVRELERPPALRAGERLETAAAADFDRLHRGAHPCRRHRPGRGVPALPRRARGELQPGGDPRDRRRRGQHERLDADQACRGRYAGPA